jgi:hypothetical protein
MRPADLHLDLRGSGQGFVITHNGRPVSRTYRGRHLAYAAMAGVERQMLKPHLRTRPCLCCQTPITSEGPHHRLCDPCRSGGA